MSDEIWYEDRSNVAALLRWLADGGWPGWDGDAAYVVEKPWKWTSQYLAFRAWESDQDDA